MKVLHVIPSLSPIHGGPTHALEVMERALSRAGVLVETCTTDDDGPHRRSGKPLATRVAENGVGRRYFRKRTEFYKVAPGLAAWLLRHVREYDLVHIHALFSFSSLAAAYAARRAKVPYIVRPLGTLSRFGIAQRRPWIKRLSLHMLEKPLLESARAVHFTSLAEQAEAVETGFIAGGEVIPLAVEPVQAASPAAITQRHPELSGRPVVLFLSRIDPKKNLEGLLEAFALAGADMPGHLLLVAGDGDSVYIETLKARAARSGVADRVVWAGHLGGELKASAFAAAQVFVLPSYSENFGMAAAEALAAGIPCLLGAGVAIAQEVEQAGAGLVVSTEPGSIAVALACLVRDPARRERMGVAASTLARERYSAESMAARLKTLYTRVLA